MIDEIYIEVDKKDFPSACLDMHKKLHSPAMMCFAEDERIDKGRYGLYCVFIDIKDKKWVFVKTAIPENDPNFNSMSRDMHSANLFEREIKEMYGLEPIGNPDIRRLRLHDEVWPEGFYPLRKDFKPPELKSSQMAEYVFQKVEGEGVFEIPVGPVHAGIIGPGHFRFSAAGEPIINLEIRLGWTHRGVEKLLEGKTPFEAVSILECISGDTAFGYSAAFCHSVETILGINIPSRAQILRVLCLELERLYNHANDMGGIALDVGFSFPAQFASLIKENILQVNERFSGSRYLKNINTIGGVDRDIDRAGCKLILEALVKVREDFLALEDMLFSNNSFMDRVDTTGVLHAKTARDLGITGLAGRASGIALDLRKVFPYLYGNFSFNMAKEQAGDVTARLKIRCSEVKESVSLIRQCMERLDPGSSDIKFTGQEKEGSALGYVEAWRGPVLVWTRLNAEGKIERCKIVDPSFRNWTGLSFAVLGNIVPDFPLCNKSFDLSYSGNDL